ncbi:hypothetical protein ACWD3J_02780 [Streptomyces sp. NPDC002755]|uniref:hypothetical protein n=1 Tax=Streptomyces sp. NPDC002884 TaxID=3154544 RepID=UPI00331EE775
MTSGPGALPSIVDGIGGPHALRAGGADVGAVSARDRRPIGVARPAGGAGLPSAEAGARPADTGLAARAAGLPVDGVWPEGAARGY